MSPTGGGKCGQGVGRRFARPGGKNDLHLSGETSACERGHRGAGWVVLLGGRSSQAADMSLISAGAVHRVTNEREKQVMRTVGSEERVGSDLRLLRRGRGGFAVRMV